jgi:hypothetical protein
VRTSPTGWRVARNATIPVTKAGVQASGLDLVCAARMRSGYHMWLNERLVPGSRSGPVQLAAPGDITHELSLRFLDTPADPFPDTHRGARAGRIVRKATYSKRLIA